MAIHSSPLAWRIPWTGEPGGLQSLGSQESDTTERVSTQLRASLSALHQLPSAQALCESPQPCSRLPAEAVPEKGTPQLCDHGALTCPNSPSPADLLPAVSSTRCWDPERRRLGPAAASREASLCLDEPRGQVEAGAWTPKDPSVMTTIMSLLRAFTCCRGSRGPGPAPPPGGNAQQDCVRPAPLLLVALSQAACQGAWVFHSRLILPFDSTKGQDTWSGPTHQDPQSL